MDESLLIIFCRWSTPTILPKHKLNIIRVHIYYIYSKHIYKIIHSGGGNLCGPIIRAFCTGVCMRFLGASWVKGECVYGIWVYVCLCKCMHIAHLNDKINMKVRKL